MEPEKQNKEEEITWPMSRNQTIEAPYAKSRKEDRPTPFAYIPTWVKGTFQPW